jgi:hypothetical protein
VAPSIEDQGLGEPAADDPHPSPSNPPRPAVDQGPDPVIGAGITLLGIFLMGTGGARDAHYVFDVGVLVAVLGAGTFVISVALSAMKQRRAQLATPPPPAPPPPAAAA